ncbi:MAG: hypothetical protein Q8N26_02740 [Myxococcales bacterium]|nr:hypothetical protein [Myxococcales bacterium]
MSGGSAGGFGRPEPWGGTHPVVSPDLLLAVAASSSNGQLATVTSADGGVFVDTINAARFFAPGTLADLDARFGSVVLTTSNGVWLLNSALQWWPVTGSPSSPAVGLSTPIFRPPSGAEQLASYWRTSPSTVSLYSTPPFSTDGGIPPGLSMSTTVLPNPMTFRVRPDSSGQSGVIAGSFSLDGGCEPGSQAVFGRISSQNASVEGGSVPACDMMVASSEAQTALLVWRARDMMGRIHAAFWQPGGLNGLPTEPDHWLSSSFGILPVDAIATDGVRHAAIVYQPANSVLTSGDAGVETGASGYVLIVLRSSSPPRFIDLGPRAVPPFSLAFGVSGAQGVFVLANCSISGGGVVGICATPGAVVGFLAQP